MTNEITIQLTLSDAEAWAIAQLCKRITWSDLRSNAVNDGEAYHMMDAINKLQRAMAETGYAPR